MVLLFWPCRIINSLMSRSLWARPQSPLHLISIQDDKSLSSMPTVDDELMAHAKLQKRSRNSDIPTLEWRISTVTKKVHGREGKIDKQHLSACMHHDKERSQSRAASYPSLIVCIVCFLPLSPFFFLVKAAHVRIIILRCILP
jgi:hypothetical protein